MADLYLLVPLLLISCVLTRLVIGIANKTSILDTPVDRSSHRHPTPLGGGIAIACTFYVAVAYMDYRGAITTFEFAALLGGSVIALLGFVDDLREVDYRIRIFVQFSAAIWAVSWLGVLPAIQLGPFDLELAWVSYILVPLALVWLLNLYNFMDGIDGLAGAETCFVSSVAFAVLLMSGDTALAFLSGALFAGTIGFLFWNWPPAKIFMGDVGSGFVGYSLGILALISIHHGSMTLWSWILLLGVFLVDATVTLLKRVKAGEIWHRAHNSHAYQHAARKYNSHSTVSVSILLINTLWLFPLSWLALNYPQYGALLATMGIVPLVLLAIFFGAGQREAT